MWQLKHHRLPHLQRGIGCRESRILAPSLGGGFARSCGTLEQILGGFLQEQDGITQLAVCHTLESLLGLVRSCKLYNRNSPTRWHEHSDDLAVWLEQVPELVRPDAVGEVLD